MERQEGALVVELSKKHNISIPRVHRICMQEENKVLKEQLLRCELKLNSQEHGKN